MDIGHMYSWQNPLQLVPRASGKPNNRTFGDPASGLREHNLINEQDGLASDTCYSEDHQFSASIKDQAVFSLDDRENEEIGGGKMSSSDSELEDDLDNDDWIGHDLNVEM